MTRDAFAAATDVQQYLDLVGQLVKSDRPFRYTYMPSVAYARLSEFEERSRVYWYEILERAHCLAIAAIVRADRWLSSLIMAAEAENFPAFAASFRGLLESAADTRFSLGDVPKGLATAFPHAREAVSGKATRPTLAPDLENALIHFSHGRKVDKGECAPGVHAAKTMREYLSALQGATTGPLFSCYEELCNATHPAADSILYLLEERGDGALVFAERPDEKAITHLCDRGGAVVQLCVRESLVYPLMILRVVNRFELPELLTPGVEHISLNEVPLWREIEAQFRPVPGDTVH
jgi:hypothetical protein